MATQLLWWFVIWKERLDMILSMDIREEEPKEQFELQKSYCWLWRCLCSCNTLTAWQRNQRWRPQFGPSGCCQRSQGSSLLFLSHTLHLLFQQNSSVHLLPGHRSGCQGSWTNPVCGRGSMTCRSIAPQGSGWTRCCNDTAGPLTGTAQHASSHLSQTHEPLSNGVGGHLWEDKEIMRKDQ